MDEIVLKLDNVYLSSNDGFILSNINTEIIKDSFVSVIGRSGSGKTSLLKVMAGLQVPDDGKVIIFNKDIGDYGYEEMLPIRKKIGFAFQDSALLSNLSIKENLTLGLDFHFSNLSRQDKDTKVRKMLDKLMLLHTLNQRPAELSLGEKKLISIARAMITDPDILFLDEPFAFIDISVAKMVTNFIREYADKENTTVICVTNSRTLINDLADYIILIENGNIVLNSTKEKINSTEKNERPQIINDILG